MTRGVGVKAEARGSHERIFSGQGYLFFFRVRRVRARDSETSRRQRDSAARAVREHA